MKNIVPIIKNGGVAVIKTDTLYGIVGSAHDQFVVDKIYSIKKRDILKPVIVLISDISDIKEFGIYPSNKIIEIVREYWPGKVSIIFPVDESVDLHYLHKGTGGIAFRIPDNMDLRELLRKTGPLVAPSANTEGSTPAKNISEAMAYFGNSVDYYKDDGECDNDRASKIIRINDDLSINIIRD